MQAYSDPKREADPYALPDIEVFEDEARECEHCGHTMTGTMVELSAQYPCPGCKKAGAWNVMGAFPNGAYWYWPCSPGCLPDGDPILPDGGPIGPFKTEAEALADARHGIRVRYHG
jgi:hypothetical protein